MATAEADIQNKIRKDKESSKEVSENSQETLEENVNVKSENIKAEQIKLSSEEDLESLLKLAEELREKIDISEKNNFIFFYRVAQIIYIIVPIFFYLYYSPFIKYSYVILFVTIPFIIFCEYRIKIIRNRCLPDKLALKEVLQLLREVHGTIAEREDWSILKRAEFRIRLSRFDLSEKKESVFSFFS